MPINKKYPLEKVIEGLKSYAQKNQRKIFIQYTLIDSINDSKSDAQSLVEVLKDLPSKVNLIPYNTIPGSRFGPPPIENIKQFQSTLLQRGLRATVRFSKGWDIDAACGQLVLNKRS